MKNLILALFIILFIGQSYAKTPVALFSPTRGAQAFAHMYQAISVAREYAHVTVYSWSDANFDKALMAAAKNGAKVRVVIHPTLKNTATLMTRFKNLEKVGVEIKISPINMHEKFIIVDGIYMVNSSANMSNGAKTKYAESFIFLDNSADENKLLINDFINEFTILWNSSYDLITQNEGLVAPLNTLTKKTNTPTNSTMSLYSSSMNWYYTASAKGSQKANMGASYTMSRLGGTKNQTWTVRDMIIKNIRTATKNIYVNLNHFNIREIALELLTATKRGVQVFLMMDNQEYKSRPNNKEMTPEFVQGYKTLYPGKAVPVRILYYSHNPSPRYWYLNHNKTILIDYGTAQTKLLTGSFNLSRTAEHNQFDNLVLYQGSHLNNLYSAFYYDFLRLWSQNRTKEDRPEAQVYNQYFTPNAKGQYILHSTHPLSLTWDEVTKLRSDVDKVAPGILKGGFQKRDCYYYAPKTGSYSGC